MKKKLLKTTLLYNLILFDFILLETSSNRISNFFFNKFQKKKNYLIRLSLYDTFLSFKQYLKLLRYFKKIKHSKFNKIFIWTRIEEVLNFFLSFFKKSRILKVFSFNEDLPIISQDYFKSKLILLFDIYLKKSQFFSFFFNKLFFIQSISSKDIFDYSTYKLLSNYNDYKKLIFFALTLKSIYKI